VPAPARLCGSIQVAHPAPPPEALAADEGAASGQAPSLPPETDSATEREAMRIPWALIASLLVVAAALMFALW